MWSIGGKRRDADGKDEEGGGDKTDDRESHNKVNPPNKAPRNQRRRGRGGDRVRWMKKSSSPGYDAWAVVASSGVSPFPGGSEG